VPRLVNLGEDITPLSSRSVAGERENSQRDSNLDVLRAIAALGVVATHARWLAGTVGRSFAEQTLWSGMRMTVYLFFAVSGFLIGRPFLVALLEGGPQPRIGAYAARRVARIVPAYWLALTVLLLLGLQNPGNALSISDHYLLLQSEVPGDPGSLYPIAWTLGVEAAFYLALPLVVVPLSRRLRRPPSHRAVAVAILVLTAASVALNLATYTRVLPTGGAAVVQYALPAQFMFFAPGLLVVVGEHYLGVRGQFLPRLFGTRFVLACLLAAGGWFGGMALFVEATRLPAGLSSVAFALVSALTLVIARSRPPCRSIVGRTWAELGVVSYGLYLWHWIVMREIFRYWGNTGGPFRRGFVGWWGAADLLVVVTVPLAALSWLCIERPAMRYVARRLRTGEPPEPAPSELAVAQGTLGA